jgi:hypothetical protein
MRVLVHVRGTVDEVDLWPYVTSTQPLTDDSLLAVEVSDSRELVCVLVALTDRGLDVVEVQTLDAEYRGSTDGPGTDP